ncbi:MAG: C69 family dipeptidase [Pseudomonadota bacterium]|nr:C69 family dipeptidase [Pseudomonadota bacterium]
MCDTQVVLADDAVWFTKNSDREPSEPQPVVRYAAVRGDGRRTVRVSHIEVEQLADRHAVILSQPAWCWGAEMGVNDAGVVIGNEAIFSKRASLRPALLGMDLVRLGLERAGSSRDAIGVMTALLERYGQGGPAGYADKSFCYDSSFLVADRHEAWVLESAGRSWAARRIERTYAISNALTLKDAPDLVSADLPRQGINFAGRFDTRVVPYFAGSALRRQLALRACDAGAESWASAAARLRQHRGANGEPAKGSNADVCMHAAGYIRRHQTTGSMIARLDAQGATAAFTGTSAPCLSIFRPASFAQSWSVLTAEAQRVQASLWRRHEWLHRWALADPTLRERLRATRDQVEAQIFALLDQAGNYGQALQRADRLAAAWHKVLWESLKTLETPRLARFWARIATRDGIDPQRVAALDSAYPP